MAVFVNDTFTDTEGTVLTSHTGETGATWAKHLSAGNGTPPAIRNSGTALRSEENNSEAWYYASGSPAGADYSATTFYVVNYVSNANQAGAGVRHDTSAATGYQFLYNSNFGGNLIRLRKVVAGTFTALGTDLAVALGTGDTFALTCEAIGTAIKGYIQRASDSKWLTSAGAWQAGKTACISATDAAISAAGKSAVMIGSRSLGDGEVTAFSAQDAVVGPTITAQPADQTVNEGSTATLSVTATGTAPFTYQWESAPPGSSTFSNVGTNSSSYTTGALTPAADHGRAVKVDVSDANGGPVTSTTATITVRSTTTASRPASDVAAAGWTPSTGTVLFDMLDETAASDADYITSPSITATPAPAVMALQYPLAAGAWNIGIRAACTGAGATMRVKLLDAAGSVVGTSADQLITSTLTTYTLPITIGSPAYRVSVEVVS